MAVDLVKKCRVTPKAAGIRWRKSTLFIYFGYSIFFNDTEDRYPTHTHGVSLKKKQHEAFQKMELPK
jgi:hypothetical protein